MNHEILNILKYVRPGGGFVPKFPVFGKVEVNGLNEESLFTYLKVMFSKGTLFQRNVNISYLFSLTATTFAWTGRKPICCLFHFVQQESLPFVNPVIGDIKKFYWSPIKVNDIRWNFEKFLITADGVPFRR